MNESSIFNDMENNVNDSEFERFIITLINDTTLSWCAKYRLVYDYKSYRNHCSNLGSYLPGTDRDDVAKEMVKIYLEEARGEYRNATN